MFETLKNAFKSKEIRVKIWLTLALILVYRVGCYIPVPTFDATALTQAFTEQNSDFLGLLNILSGGSMANATIFALGVLPFINSSIIMQLLALVIPALEKKAMKADKNLRKSRE